MLDSLLVILLGSLLFLAGYILLTSTLQYFLKFSNPPPSAPVIYLWSAINSLPPLLLPVAAILELPAKTGSQLAAGITIGCIFALLTLAPGVLALVYAARRRFLLRAPLWESRTGFTPQDSLVLGDILLLSLLASEWLLPLQGIGAAFLLWLFLFFVKRSFLAIPPLLPSTLLFERFWPAALLQGALAVFLLVCGANYLIEGCLKGGGYDSFAFLLFSLFIVPLMSQLYPLLTLLGYAKKGQDYLVWAYLVGSLIPLVTLLPVVIITLGVWTLNWPQLTALVLSAFILLLFNYRIKTPAGLTPLLLLAVSTVYPLYLIVLWLVG